MARAPQIAVQISAVDQYTAVMARFRKELASITGPVQAFNKQMQTSGNSSVFASATAGLDAVRQRAQAAVPHLAALAPGLGVLAGAGTIAGIGAMASQFGAMGLSLRNTAAMAGMSAGQLANLQGAARTFGVSADTASSAVVGLNSALQGATYGRDPTAVAGFDLLGIAFRDMRGNAISAGAALPRVVDALSRLYKVNPTSAARLADAFHIPRDALPMFARGTDELQRRMEVSARQNAITADSIDAADRYTAAQGNLTNSAVGLRNVLVTRLEPGISATINGLTGWLEQSTRTEEGIRRVTLAAEVLAGTALFRYLFGARALAGVAGGLLGAAAGPVGALGSTLALSGDTNRNATPDGVYPGFKPDNRSMGERFRQWWQGGRPETGPNPGAGDRFPIPPGGRPGGAAGPMGALGGPAAPVPMSGNTQDRPGRMSSTGFENQYGAIAAWIGQQQGVDPRVILGKIDLESGTGNYRGGRNNPFNLTTNGPNATEVAGYRYANFNNLEEAAAEYVGRNRRLWPGSTNTGRDVNQYVQGLRVGQRGGYAESVGATVADRQRLYAAGIQARMNMHQGWTPPAVPAAPAVAAAPPQPVVQPVAPPAVLQQERRPNDNGQSTVRIDVSHNNAPQGVTLKTSMEGEGVEMGNIRVRRAMPE